MNNVTDSRKVVVLHTGN